MGESNKITKATVLYVFNPPAKYECQECAFYNSTGECTYYIPAEAKVKPYGSCNAWTYGAKGHIKGNSDHTREATGYTENREGFSCGRCEEFVADTKRCRKVDEKEGLTPGTIQPRSCCNRWSPDPIRAKLSEDKLRSLKEFR